MFSNVSMNIQYHTAAHIGTNGKVLDPNILK
jgi:hypothetical protein